MNFDYLAKMLNSINIIKVKREELAKKLKSYWFYDTKNPNKPRIYDGFYGYKPDFIYLYKDLAYDTRYDEILKLVINDINKFNKHIKDIKDCINNFENKDK